jgi:hypothetical protein
MEQHEFNPEAHEEYVSRRLLEARKQAARMAIFDEMIDYHLDGQCSFDEAVAQYLHDIERDGAGYEATS